MDVQQPTLSRIELKASPQFAGWLAGAGVSLAISTYQSGNVILIGTNSAGGLSICTRMFVRPMGMAFDGCRLAVATLRQIVTLGMEAGRDGYDAVFVQQDAFNTALIDTHDLVFGPKGNVIFVNTRYSCLATAKAGSFRVLWRPPFISKHAPEDRCHLNGMAVRDGLPAYVTVVAETDVASGWRDKRASGGVVIDVTTNEVVCRGLSMPHSPRLYKDQLWILNSGSGDVGVVDMSAGRFVPMAFCPGYLRGLAFVGDYALVGLSKLRDVAQPCTESWREKLAIIDVQPRCAVYVIDTRSGDLVHWLRIEGTVSELYDIVVLSRIKRPMMTGRFVGKGELNG